MRLGRGSLGRQRESFGCFSASGHPSRELLPCWPLCACPSSVRPLVAMGPVAILPWPCGLRREAWAQTQLPLSSAAKVMWVVGGLSLWATIPSCPFKHRQQAPWPALHNAVPPVYFHLVHGHAVDVGFLRWTGFPGADRCHQRRQPSWIITTQTN